MTIGFLLPTARCLGLGAALIFLGGTSLEAARKTKAKAEADSEAPRLLSTEGGAEKSRWPTLAELERAANGGDPEASVELAFLLEEGKQLPRNLPRALALYEHAGRQGIGRALFRLGKIYHDGLGVEPDEARSFPYYQRAALAGVPEAYYNVGAMLVSGRGVRRNYVEGLAWLILSTKSGADPSGEQQVRARLASRPRDIAAAERRAVALQKEIEDGIVAAKAAPRGTAPPPPSVPRPAPTIEAPTPERVPIAPPPPPPTPGFAPLPLPDLPAASPSP